jgi:hypothetical protein
MARGESWLLPGASTAAAAAILIAMTLPASRLPNLGPSTDAGFLALEANDGLGADLSPFLAGHLQHARASDVFLIAVMGTCGSCSSHHFLPGDELPDRYRKVIFIYDGESDNKVENVIEAAGPAYGVYFDTTRAISQRLNVIVPPRLYEVDAAGFVTRAETGVQSLDQMRRQKK